MRIAVLFGPLCLALRGSFDFDTLRTDPRGLTGSELGFIRIAEELKSLGYDVTVFTKAEQGAWYVGAVRPLEQLSDHEFDVAIAINEPQLLKNARARLRVCEFWLNDVTFCPIDFDKHVDLFISPSRAHREQVMLNEDWHRVAVSPNNPGGAGAFTPNPGNWIVNPLGCDPERYPQTEKVPGRVVYCSSPDRGLHWTLQEWPAIKRAVPHATLKIFYRLQPWIDAFKQFGYHGNEIELSRSRALYIEAALERLRDPEWGITVCDSVSREQIEREMCEAEVLAYHCDTVKWSEGFSCTTLEACAAEALPIISDCDAMGEVYGGSCPTVKRGQLHKWRELVIRALEDKSWRETRARKARKLAESLTWAGHAVALNHAIRERLDG